jgi:putative nucleotidyltransferase with HDIG domain
LADTWWAGADLLDEMGGGVTVLRTDESEATRDLSRTWRTRPVLSVALTLVTVVVPVAASVIATRFAADIVPRPRHGAWVVIGWWAMMLAVASVVVFGIERVTRRLAPLAALMKLTLVFPDRAPSRFSVALRSGTVKQLHDRYETIKRDGLGATPAEAARTVVELIGALNAHDHVTRGHCERVRAYTAMIAEELKLPAVDVDRLRWAGLLHDLGKLDVPSEILNKKGKLDEAEWEIVKTHPAAGARIAAPLAGWLGEGFRAIAEHHERWDGAGYPASLSGEEISLGGRIVAVADAFDVMTAARSYKRPNSPTWARTELVRCSGSQFDPLVVRAFVNLSLGRLRWTIGPLSWLAQLPLLAQGPITAVSGTMATTAMAATVVAGASAFGTLPAAAEPTPIVMSAVAQHETLVLADSVTMLITTTSTAPTPVTLHTNLATANSTTTAAPHTTQPLQSTSTTTPSPTPEAPTNLNQAQSTGTSSAEEATATQTAAPISTAAPKPTAAPKAKDAPKAKTPKSTDAPKVKDAPKTTDAPKGKNAPKADQGSDGHKGH